MVERRTHNSRVVGSIPTASTETALFGVIILQPQGSKRIKKKRIKNTFQKRQKARQWCRNNWHKVDHVGMEITHPGRPNEPFRWNGIL